MTNVPAQRDTLTILLVEDDVYTREFLEFLLMTADYHVVTAASGASALAQAQAHTVNAVLLDRRLPDMDGVQVCRLLRQYTTVPVVILTADLDPTLDTAARAAGATAVLSKPFLPDEFLERLATLIAPM